MSLKRILLACACFGFASLGAARAEDVTLHGLFQSQAGYQDQEVRDMTADYMKLHPNVKVELEFVPYEALHDKAVLARGSASGYDVILSDTIFTPEYASHHIVLDVTDRVTQAMKAGILPGAMRTAEWHGRIYGLPWIVDAKFLFYNKAMFKKAGIAAPPRTWPELEQDAITLKQKGVIDYPLVSSWGQTESLVADYGTILAGFGGTFLDASGKPVFQTDGGLEAAKFMARAMLTEKIVNPHSLEFNDDDVKKVFSSGQAAMALNWTYNYSANTPGPDTTVSGDVGVVPAPGVKPGDVGTVNGTQPLCIPANSKHVEAAWDFITYLTSKQVQDSFATNSLPMWHGSFQEPKVIAGRPDLMSTAEASFAAMIPRPEVVNYQQFSVTLQQSLQQVATAKMAPDAALQAAAETLSSN